MLYTVLCCSCPEDITHTSQPSSHTILFSGSIPTAAYSSFQTGVAATIKERFKSDKKVGSQNTPAFIHAAVQDAAANVAAGNGASAGVSLPKGGFTDVSQQDGNPPRNTSWPLVKQTLLVRCCLTCTPQTRVFHSLSIHGRAIASTTDTHHAEFSEDSVEKAIHS